MKELIPNEIYVSKGGTLIQKKSANPVPWGYDRVKFLRIENNRIIVATPWGSECSLDRDYLLANTIETIVRSEFPLRSTYESLQVIPFRYAVDNKICKELSMEELQKLRAVIPQEIVGSDLTSQVIDYLATPRTIADTASHFGAKYQKIRYIIKQLETRGYGIYRFKIMKSKIDNKDTFQLIRIV